MKVIFLVYMNPPLGQFVSRKLMHYMLFTCTLIFMPPRRRVGGHINLPLSVRIQIHGLFSCLLLQFWSYSFNILQDVYTHNGGVHVHNILIFFKYFQNDRQLDNSHFFRTSCIKETWFIRLSPPTALIFCRMFIHIMKVCMSTGF